MSTNLPLRLFVIAVVATLAVAGCGVRTQQDGPPASSASIPEYVPDAVPRLEAKSRYGNPKSYEVFGKRYYTLATSNNYVEKGVASWYGTKFHGRRTSSGEVYDMYAMTAAHKTLPLPTYAQVTNLSNKESIIVRINDRGPFHDNRVIDLSYSAAKRLGVLQKGTAFVEVRALDPLTWNKPKSPVVVAQESTYVAPSEEHEKQGEEKTDADLYLQVGAFSQFDNAKKLSERVAQLAAQSARIHEIRNDLGAVFRVQVGPLDSVAQADRIRSTLVDAGFQNLYLVVE